MRHKVLLINILLVMGFVGCDTPPRSYSTPPPGTQERSLTASDAEFYLMTGDFTETIAVCEVILENNPNDHAVRHAMARVLGQLDRCDEALEHARRATELSPSNIEYWHTYGWTSSGAYQYENAVIAYNKVFELNSYGTPNAYNGRAWANVQLGHLDTVLEDVNMAIEADPYNDAYIDTRAVYWLKAGDLEQAMIDIDYSIELAPYDGEHHYHKGLIYMELEQWVEAYDQFTLAYRYNPNQRDIDELLETTETRVVELFKESSNEEDEINQ